ncbi:hypothetical protein [Tranquillimonas alkanivorans]|uniref:hypothetical protein n=1 Tax=Tranquillimonas alkanivorans TaxID=441119 RepID=UPI0015A587B0|nr:hypothetical protein [Tranquillimonas alkanivorans]
MKAILGAIALSPRSLQGIASDATKHKHAMPPSAPPARCGASHWGLLNRCVIR